MYKVWTVYTTHPEGKGMGIIAAEDSKHANDILSCMQCPESFKGTFILGKQLPMKSNALYVEMNFFLDNHGW